MRRAARLAVLLGSLTGAFLGPAATQSEELSSEIPGAPVPPVPSVMHAGTGSVVHEEGIVLTNAHVVEGCSAVTAGPYTATRIVRDQQNDMALLFLETDDELPSLSFSPDPIRLAPQRLHSDTLCRTFLLKALT